VPNVLLGKYLIIVYDGSENGFHYTWELFTVLPSAQPSIPSQDGPISITTWLPIVVALVTGIAAGWFLPRRFLH
jgi:hypothetical protein